MLRAAISCWLLVASASAAGSYVITAPQTAQRGSDFVVTVLILNATNVRVVATLQEQTFIDGVKVTPIVNASGTFSSGRPGRLVLADPNGNKIKVESNVTSESSVIEDSLQLSDQPVFGTWTIELNLQEVKEITSQTFEVSQYELPTFEVIVETQPYALIGDELLTGKVTAKYTFGQLVQGFVELQVGPNRGPDTCGNVPRSTQIGFEINGNASFSIPREDINQVVPLFDGAEVRITAFVKEEATGVRLNGSTVVTFRQSRYQVKFTDNTANVFKPGLQYNAFIQVTTPDNKPPTDTNITLSVYTSVDYQQTVPDQALYNVAQFSGTYGLPGQNITVPPSGLVSVNITIPSNATRINIKATVNSVQATKTVEKMYSPSNNYIQLSLDDTNIKAGTTVTVRVTATEPIDKLYYKVLARGSEAVSGVVKAKGRSSLSFPLAVSTAFAPTSYLLVYYTRGLEEIVADNLAFLVDGLFNNTVTVAFNKNETQPNQEVVLLATASPGSNIYILAVDKSVQLVKTGNDITREKVSTAVKQFSDGQSPTDPEFPLSSSATYVRDVFAIAQQQLITDVETPFPQQFRYQYARSDWGAPQPLVANMDAVYFSAPAPPSRLLFKQSELKEVDRVRQYFPEVWAWSALLSCDNGTASFAVTTPDSITSWSANAFATHPTAGLGVAAYPANLTVFKPFFVTYTLPTEVVRGEQLVLRPVVFNFLGRDLEVVVVTLTASSKFQSVEVRRDGSQRLLTGDQVQRIRVNSGDQGVANFPIVFNEIGVVEIEIKAQSSSAADGIRRFIVVKSEGAPVRFNYPQFINLNGETYSNSTVFSLPPSAVNGSDRARIKATGDVIGFSLNSLVSLVELPTGCGEQSMVKTAPNLYIAQYLQTTGQFTGQWRAEIIKYLEAGYQRQLSYQRVDGGFSAFGNSDQTGSTWLTAYVVRVFVDVRTFVYVDPTFLLKGTDWLVDRQNLDGSFNEFGKLLDTSIQGAGTGSALTSFVLLALLKMQSLARTDCVVDFDCPRVSRWGNATSNAIRNLERLVDSNSITDQFSLALASYALAEANSSRAVTVFGRLEALARNEGGLRFWADNSTVAPGQTSQFDIWRPPRVQSRPINVLISGYAVLTYVALNRIQDALPSVLWLTTQRNPSGGFVSSQDTSVALQALAAYATETTDADTNINIKVSNGATALAEFNITSQNALQQQIRELSRAPSRADVVATGTGLVFLEVVILFNTNKPLSTPSFEVSTVLIDDNLNSFNLLICTRWLWSRESGMVVQTISVPSGFSPDMESLGNIAGLRRTERRGNTVNVYFDRIGTTSVCYSIRMTRTDKVVKIRENYIITSAYYNPSDQTVSFWQPERLAKSTACEVCLECCP
ncbi:hypothetical protein BsWGS_17971 [Bradybaena similaris]